MRALYVLPLMSLAACQSAPRAVPPDTTRAACLGQEYLRVNGFLNEIPTDRVTLLDTDLRYEVDGVLQYERLVKERRNRFTRKLQGVWMQPDSPHYLVVYGPIEKRQYCLGIGRNFSFAWVRKTCAAEGVFTKLRERDLNCGTSD